MKTITAIGVNLHKSLLCHQGRFVETSASKDAHDRLANLGSPVRAFITECCELDPDARVAKRDLYNAWRDYARENDLYAGTLEKFCEAIYAATSGKVKAGKPRIDGERIPSVIGIRLLDPNERPIQTNCF